MHNGNGGINTRADLVAAGSVFTLYAIPPTPAVPATL